MLIGYKRGQVSIVLRIKIFNSSVSTGAGLTGLSSTSSGLIISTIADNEATATAYTVAASNVETVTTLGTFAAPTAGKCRFREVDATNHKGVYEIQLADDRYGVSNAKSLLVSVAGATNAAETDVVIPLRDLDPFDAVRAGLTALPNVASGSAGSLLTSGTGTSQLNVSGGKAAANMVEIAGQTATAATAVTFPATVSSLTASGVRAELTPELSFVDVAVSSRLASASYATPPTAVQNATQVRTELATELGRIDATVSSRLATASYVTPLDAAGIRSAVGLSAANIDSQFDAIPTALENASAVRTELTIELGRIDVAVSSRLSTAAYSAPPSAAANATAVRSELTTELAMIDVPVSSRLASGSYVAPLSAAGTRAAIGLAAANLDTQLAALPLASVWTTTRAGYLDQVLLAEDPAKRTVKVTGSGSGHIAADVHDSQPGSIHATTFEAGAIDATALAASASDEIADALLDRADAIETGLTLRGALRIDTAALAGKVSGAAGTSVAIRNVGDTKTRISATVDADGNRTAITVDAS